MKPTRSVIICAAFPLLTGTASALTTFSDNFDAASLSKTRWTLKNYGNGKLAQAAGKINSTVASSPTKDDFGLLELKNNRPGYNESWEVILDVKNTANQGSKVGTGFLVYNADDYGDQVGLEFNGTTGFVTIMTTDDNDNPAGDIRQNPRVTKGSLRISFDKTTKLFTFWYDSTGSADGLVWTRLATFSPTGKGGDRRGNWKMNPAGGRFGIQLYGFAEDRTVAGGKVSFDNFKLKAVR